ncbi:MAG: hypothetical protein ACRDK8_07135 [Solirubrobacteraceae bacterium]
MSEAIVDPVTSQTLQERTLVSAAGAGALGLRAGTVVSTTTYLARAITDTIRTP